MLQLLFYASPIIYPIGFLPPWARKLAFLNPFTQVLQDIRALVLYPDLAAEHDHRRGCIRRRLGRLLPIAIALALVRRSASSSSGARSRGSRSAS